jgi:hypothetical protein
VLPFSFARLHRFPAFALTEVIVTGKVLDGMVYQTPDRSPYGFCERPDGPTPTLTYVSMSRLNTPATESLSIGGLERGGRVNVGSSSLQRCSPTMAEARVHSSPET